MRTVSAMNEHIQTKRTKEKNTCEVPPSAVINEEASPRFFLSKRWRSIPCLAPDSGVLLRARAKATSPPSPPGRQARPRFPQEAPDTSGVGSQSPRQGQDRGVEPKGAEQAARR